MSNDQKPAPDADTLADQTPSDEPPEDPRARALRLRQQRNTGPHARDRAPRQLGVDGPP